MHDQKPDLYHSVALFMLYSDRMVRFELNGWISRNLQLNTLQATNLQAPIFSQIVPARELLLELRLYESYCIINGWGRNPFQGFAPGRAAQK